MSICDCGCGHEVGSLEFIRLHVETEGEQDRRMASELLAEQEAAYEVKMNEGLDAFDRRDK